LFLVGPDQSAGRAENRVRCESEWIEANRSVPLLRLTGRKAAAAVATAKADIIEWMSSELADPPASIPVAMDQLTELLGDHISTDFLNALDAILGSGDQRKRKARLAACHLFCSLLASLACAMQRFGDDLNKAFEEVAGRITSYYIGRKQIKHPSFITKVVAQAAAKGISRVIQKTALAQNFTHLKLAVRFLAVMACPAPEKHEEIVRCCLKPIGQPIISAAAQDRLKAAMPKWME
jgi:hypothetical protein